MDHKRIFMKRIPNVLYLIYGKESIIKNEKILLNSILNYKWAITFLEK